MDYRKLSSQKVFGEVPEVVIVRMLKTLANLPNEEIARKKVKSEAIMASVLKLCAVVVAAVHRGQKWFSHNDIDPYGR